MQKLKILFFDHEKRLGGAELSLVDLASVLKDHTELHLAINGPGELEDALRQKGAERIYHISLDSWRLFRDGLADRIKLLFALPLFVRNIYRCYRLIKKTRPDIIHLNLSRMIEPILAARICKVKCIVHYRESNHTNRRFIGYPGFFFYLLGKADYWIANSMATYRDIFPHRRMNEMRMIYNGISISSIIPKAEYKQHDTIHVAMLAGIVPWKNYESYLETAREVKARNSGLRFLFHIAGKGREDYLQKLQTTTAEYNISDMVVFDGFVEDVPAFLNRADIIVHTSYRESFGRVYIEAMAAGLPVVAIKGGAVEEIVQDGDTGYLFEKEQVKEMADHVIRLASDPELRRQMGEKGRQRVLDIFTIEASASQVLKLYYEMLLNPSLNAEER